MQFPSSAHYLVKAESWKDRKGIFTTIQAIFQVMTSQFAYYYFQSPYIASSCWYSTEYRSNQSEAYSILAYALYYIYFPTDSHLMALVVKGGSAVKNSPANPGDAGSIPRSGRFHPLEEEMATHSNILAWRMPWTRAWWATVHSIAKSQIRLIN